MDINLQKEEFSYAYIYAIAAAAGYSFQKSSRILDVGGIDGTITGTVSDDTLYEPQLDLQVKSISLDILSAETIRYPLKIKNYNELRKERTVAPRILVVVLIPENLPEWIKQSETELCLRRCAYWVSLRGQPQTENTETLTVYIPRENVFTVNGLKDLMQKIQTGGTL
ncbi:DUF4365 domain-containing protein [Dolichospermum planctonicum CS-1226]|uniref:DUF4365 domain-containing protein n=1 Tax=Dolichospermum planctonicum CS-1226 TaxID=3021751 RepID=A0ABT5AH03_9CYAN|nr:DUF4365 domain-containing protein [Dolichospermum planctonicum]MDB9536577.1 DUF4365 domain-containing protein [Dolichospermum planctonicum CS-1226]